MSQNKNCKKSKSSPSGARVSLKEIKAKMKKNVQKNSEMLDFLGMEDPYSKAIDSLVCVKKKTGICFDDFMSLHKCIWDPNYPECPERYLCVIKRFNELNLIQRCERLKPKQSKKEVISKVHQKDHYLHLKEICEINSVAELEKRASEYDSVYFNKHTFEAALYAVGCCIVVAENVCKGTVQNGFAVVRPPGHHAMFDEFCGYCFFNNVAITAQHVLDQNLAQKVLIVDFDVHHGQGTQQMFYNDNRVLYFSIHRYEKGKFWPNLRESNFDFVGTGAGAGYNINVPLNTTGLGDSDYLAIIQHILLPVAYEFQPQMIIISAGFDSAIGDEKGMMLTTPAFYSHLVTLLSGLANGKIVVCLEGGYFLPSLAEGAALTLRSLLGDPAPLLTPTQKPNEAVIDVINDLKYVLKPYWECFRVYEVYLEPGEGEVDHVVGVEYLDSPAPPPYPTRDCYPVADTDHINKYTEIVNDLKKEYEGGFGNSVCYCYDDDMLLHKSKREDRFEEPVRLRTLYEKFEEFDLHNRCKKLEVDPVDLEVLRLTHGDNYAKSISDGCLSEINMSKRDIYICDDSSKSILKSAGCLVTVVNEVLEGRSTCGAALIRPPGHHAESDKAMGFCFVNNVAVAANHALNHYNLERVLIVDFDVHHGNGTQKIFYESDKVLYVSVHRYDNGNYFPHSADADFDKVGDGPGKGYNVNIPLNKVKHGNSEYLSIFHRIILPIAYAYAPQLVLVSAGFDAGVNDPLGNYKVTPEAFGHFIQLLRPLANGRIVLALEGGYNPTTLAYSMVTCVKTLLGDPLPFIDNVSLINEHAHSTIQNVIRTHRMFWPVLEVNRRLPRRVGHLKVYDGHEIIHVEHPEEKLLNCGVDELRKRLNEDVNVDDIVDKLEKVVL